MDGGIVWNMLKIIKVLMPGCGVGIVVRLDY